MNFAKHKDRYSFKVNGIPVGKISRYSVSKQTDGEADNEGFLKFYFLISFRRKCDQRSEGEAINFFAIDLFDVVVERLGYRTTFNDCVIVSVSEELEQEDKPIYQTITLRCDERIRIPIE